MLTMHQFFALLDQAQPVEEEIFDIRFEQIVSLVEQEKFDEAMPLVEAVLKEGRIDIRLVMYLFYSQFLGKGIKSFIEIFPAIISLIKDQWDKITPVEARDKHTLISIGWFFSTIGKKLRRSEKLYKEKRPDDFWNHSIETLSSQDLEHLKDLTKELHGFFAEQWEDNSINQYLLFISKWLIGLEGVISLDKNDVNEPIGNEPIQERADEDNYEEEDNALYSESLSEESEEKPLLEEILVSSEPMKQFFRKIQTFEQLIEKQDFSKAALISDDITKTIENFNPTAFFPKLFSRYFALVAQHIDVLSQEWENKTSLRWQVLHQLYNADLEEFIKW